MKWTSRIIGLASGAIFAYWCGMGGDNPDWWLWAKFLLASSLGFVAGMYYERARGLN
jgi:hypothetical protein